MSVRGVVGRCKKIRHRLSLPKGTRPMPPRGAYGEHALVDRRKRAVVGSMNKYERRSGARKPFTACASATSTATERPTPFGRTEPTGTTTRGLLVTRNAWPTPATPSTSSASASLMTLRSPTCSVSKVGAGQCHIRDECRIPRTTSPRRAPRDAGASAPSRDRLGQVIGGRKPDRRPLSRRRPGEVT
jgi:hypothetical protein